MRNVRDIREAVCEAIDEAMESLKKRFEEESKLWICKIGDPSVSRWMSPIFKSEGVSDAREKSSSSKRFNRSSSSSYRLVIPDEMMLEQSIVNVEFSGDIAEDVKWMKRNFGQEFAGKFIRYVFDDRKNEMFQDSEYKVAKWGPKENLGVEINYDVDWRKKEYKFTLKFKIVKKTADN